MPVNSFENYPMSWKPTLQHSKKPLYLTLAEQLEQDIHNGTLRPGTKLPPQRELADFLDITDQLLKCGADIVEMNTIRKHLSSVKGGRFVLFFFHYFSPLFLISANQKSLHVRRFVMSLIHQLFFFLGTADKNLDFRVLFHTVDNTHNSIDLFSIITAYPNIDSRTIH